MQRSCFSREYCAKAAQIFLRPGTTYSWDSIITGVDVLDSSGGTRRIVAVGGNTFRGFHRISKECSGAQNVFCDYFLEQKSLLVRSLHGIRSRDQLDVLEETICEGIRKELTNVNPGQLKSYNKIRKPIDLYIMNLVSMAHELDSCRPSLVPFLFMPLDSQILRHPELFDDKQLSAYRLSRRSTYKDVTTLVSYRALQDVLQRKSDDVTAKMKMAFHPIYFDLVWEDRYQNWGGNLFETNP